MSNLNIDKAASFLTYMILEHVCSVPSILEKDSSFQDLTHNEWLKIMYEFLFYDLHICDRFLFDWYGAEVKAELMDTIFIKIVSNIEEKREKLLDEKLNELTLQNFRNYLKTIRDTPDSAWLIDTYNQKQIEYSKYQLFKNEDDRSWADLLYWEFAKNSSTLLDSDEKKAASVTIPISLLAMEFYKVVMLNKEILDKHYTNQS